MLKDEHYIVGVQGNDSEDLAPKARLSPSSVHTSCGAEVLETERAIHLDLRGEGNDIMFPVMDGRLEEVSLMLEGQRILRKPIRVDWPDFAEI